MRQPVKSKVIAEIGCNHKGSITIAKQMIRVAAIYCGASIVKFQKRNPKECLTEVQYNAPHPTPENSYGSTYGAHRESLEFNIDQHRTLKELCERCGVEYSCSVWDLTSAREIMRLEPAMIKIPSACNMNQPLLELIAKEHPGKIHISMGMTASNERRDIVEYFCKQGRQKDMVIYHCTSGYPVPFNQICLNEIRVLQNRFPGAQLGFSGHHLGIAADIAALTIGVHFIERHFTLDRTWKGTDHAASLEPDGLRILVRDLNNVHESLTKKPADFLPVEIEQREKLKKGQIKWTQ